MKAAPRQACRMVMGGSGCARNGSVPDGDGRRGPGAAGAVGLEVELQRSGGQRALVTMCCGGGLGTGTVLERV